MRFALDEDQQALREATREILADACSPQALRAAWSARGHAEGLWATLAEVGLLGICVPEEQGGSGMGPVALAAILEEAGRAAVPDPHVESAVAAAILGATGERSWLARLAEGRAILTTDLGTPGHFAAVSRADGFLCHRNNALWLVPARLARTAPVDSVDHTRDLGAVEWAGEIEPLASGRAAVDLAHLGFRTGALAAAAVLVGLAQQLLDTAVAYAKVRTQFGSPIGSFQAVQHQLADALVQLEFARPLVRRAAWAETHDPREAPVAVSMAKACASEAALQVARTALQVHGAIGYSTEHDLHLWMKRAWALAAAWGDAAHHRAVVADAVLGPLPRSPHA